MMEKVSKISKRKDEHLEICLKKPVESTVSAGFEKIRINHSSLPDLNFEEVDLGLSFLGKTLKAPLLISSMTGGSQEGGRYNHMLAEAAEYFGIPMGVGSQRAAMECSDLASTYQVRKQAPNILLFANLGAVQLNYGYSSDEVQRAIDMIQADAIFLHLNPLQEALQPEGNPDFSGIFEKIEAVCKRIEKPVIVKEIGSGIDARLASALLNLGVAGIDCAGLGGTSWALVEAERQTDSYAREICRQYGDWGLPTVKCLLDYQKHEIKGNIIASGGLRSGLDIFKSIALGATLGGMALPMIKAASHGEEKLYETIETILTELKIAMFNTGSKAIKDIDRTKIFIEAG